ncbi:polyphosphate polymerase domain-containing protein [Eubacteriales bacterium OttesenSCG-928-N14]|nr:polyphosphate polymerase domain-containing protein [Eubacteriales bacterium OttesenSCG-928-N14]
MAKRRPKQDRQFRHELKYYISEYSYAILQPRLSHVLRLDENANEDGEYHIRSLYFDDIDETALRQKIAGEDDRDKVRIRIYDFSDYTIKLERKQKKGQYISKDSCSITRQEYLDLLEGNPESLLDFSDAPRGFVFAAMRTKKLRPVRVVDYYREAYTYPIEDVRITFDRDLKAGYETFDIFDQEMFTVPKLETGMLIMEVKFNNYLPEFIRDIMQIDSFERRAISKYTICRQFDY